MDVCPEMNGRYKLPMIDHRLVAVALEHVDRTNFERFAQVFYGAIQDREFVPLGGIHDGGAEGFDPIGPEIFEDETSSNFIQASKADVPVGRFVQVSKQATTRKKIRDTVKRLREYGRTPKVLTYITSQEIPDIDKEESILSKELDCKISIRDAKYIEIYINSSVSTISAFKSYLEPSIQYLYRPGEVEIVHQVKESVDRTLAVFLRQEVENQTSSKAIVNSIADSLIIWALRDTDPDQGRLLSKSDILKIIEEALPAARPLIRGSIDHRLAYLSAKDAPEGRQLRHYRKEGKYCLPYETRQSVAIENADDDLLKLRVSCIFENRITALEGGNVDDFRGEIVSVCHASLEKVFERQGLKLAQFIHNDDVDDELYTNVAEIATAECDKISTGSQEKAIIRRVALNVLRGTFYKSDELERIYLGKLSRTYVLMLLLKNDLSVVEHFSKMSGKFNLYIGSDIIIRALSEHYLDAESQTTVNLLRILKESGSSLILTQKTVEEVASHIRAQIFEFENVYSSNERHLILDNVEYIDRILIRSYFYSRLSPVENSKPPANWYVYISNFADYDELRDGKADFEIGDYLVRKFGLIYESTEDMLSGLDQSEIDQLTSDIIDAKKRNGKSKDNANLLAMNDAIQVLRIYQKRKERQEASPGSAFGFQTWWLTQDQKVRRGAARAIRNNGGNFFMLRPEFILTYISLAPSQAQVRTSFEKVFPSALGVRLSSGLRSGVFERVLRSAAQLDQLDDARAASMIAKLTERLKADSVREFDVKW